MHIIIGLITAIAGLVWALNSLERSGFRLSSLNPFYWLRRNRWKKKYQENPLYNLSEPMELAAVLLIGIAKLEGEISREQKREILSIFSNEFGLDSNSASSLFSSSSFLLQNENNFIANIDKVLENTKDRFSLEQTKSTLDLMEKVASVDNNVSDIQQTLLSKIRRILHPNSNPNTKWN